MASWADGVFCGGISASPGGLRYQGPRCGVRWSRGCWLHLAEAPGSRHEYPVEQLLYPSGISLLIVAVPSLVSEASLPGTFLFCGTLYLTPSEVLAASVWFLLYVWCPSPCRVGLPRLSPP